MPRRKTNLRDGPSGTAVAAHALPVAARVRFHSMQIRSMCIHLDHIHRRRTTQTDTGLLYVDDLVTLYTHDGAGSLYDAFVEALNHRWNVEDEGP
eukprot:3243879-Pleurochrysis_carterae.AAC.1